MSRETKILIIDDEISILESLASFFEDEGYGVLTAPDGKIGIEKFLNNTVDIILTDLRMPGKDGLDVMKTVLGSAPDTPMIVISGAGKKEDIIKALRMGAKDYITKPIEDLDMISHTVSQVLENKRLNDENREYRKRLEKSEHQYRTITENIAEGVFTVDKNEKFTYSNAAFCAMVGYDSEILLSKSLRDITTKDSFAVILEQTQNRIAGSIDRYIIELIREKGDILHIELVCSPIFGSHNTYQGAIAVARDVTQIMALKKTYEKFISPDTPSSNDITPICAGCKNIRVKKGVWETVEEYFKETVFSHGICPECCKKLYPEFDVLAEEPSKKPASS